MEHKQCSDDSSDERAEHQRAEHKPLEVPLIPSWSRDAQERSARRQCVEDWDERVHGDDLAELGEDLDGSETERNWGDDGCDGTAQDWHADGADRVTDSPIPHLRCCLGFQVKTEIRINKSEMVIIIKGLWSNRC